MSKARPNIKRIFKSPTHVHFTRTMYAVPIFALVLAAAVWGDRHLLAHTGPATTSPTTALASASLSPDKAAGLSTVNSETENPGGVNHSTTSTAPSSVAPSAGVATGSTPAAVPDPCPALVANLVTTYNATVVGAKQLLLRELHDLPLVGSLVQSQDNDDYNQTVQQAYQNAQQQASAKGCSLPISAPKLN